MNGQPGLLAMILMAIVAIIAFGWLFIKLLGNCIVLLSIGLGTSPDFAVIGGFFLAAAIAIAIVIYAIIRANE